MGEYNVISKRVEEKVNRVIAGWQSSKNEIELLKIERSDLLTKIEGYKSEIGTLNESTKLIKMAQSVSSV